MTINAININSDYKKIVFGIGSNLGDKQQNINNAIENLQRKLHLENIKISTIYKNPAMLPPEAPQDWNKEFFNIAMSAKINFKKFSPLEILKIIKQIEKEIGRKDSEKWSPREIDIDILLIENEVFEIENILKIPHEGLFKRDFFYKTVAEIEGDLLKSVKL